MRLHLRRFCKICDSRPIHPSDAPRTGFIREGPSSVVLANSDLVDPLRVERLRFPHSRLGEIGYFAHPRGIAFAPAPLQIEVFALRHQLNVSRTLGGVTEAVRFRPILLVMLGSHLAELALCTDHCPTADGHWMASQRIPSLLAVEIPPSPLRSSQGSGRDARTDSPDELRKPALGSAAHPWRTPQARHRHRRNQCQQVHGAGPQAAVSDLADLPGESLEDDGVRRLLHSADHSLSDCTYSWCWLTTVVGFCISP